MCAHLLARLRSHFVSRADRLKRDLLHTSAGAKYALGQTPWSALDWNPMHFIHARVIQRDDSSVMATVYSTTEPPSSRSPAPTRVGTLWTQADPEETHATFRRSDAPTFLLVGGPSGYTDEKHGKRGTTWPGGGMFARRKWRLHSPAQCHSFVPEGFRSGAEEQGLFVATRATPRLSRSRRFSGESLSVAEEKKEI